MAEVLLSYSSLDRVKAGTLVSLLNTAGWSVWWDRENEGGQEWEARIEHELSIASCVVVLWSRNSIKSDWVLREARTARSRGVLLPALLEPVEPPAELAEIHAIPLTSWLGNERSFELRPFVARLAEIFGRSIPDLEEPPLQEAISKLSRVEVAEAVFSFCATRLRFFELRNSGVPDDILKKMGETYDRLAEILAPLSSDELHELISIHEDAFTPWDSQVPISMINTL